MLSLEAYDFNPDVKLVNVRTRAQRRRAYNQIEAIRQKFERTMRPQLRSIFEQQKQAIIALDSKDPNDVFMAINSNRSRFVTLFRWMYERISDDLLPMNVLDADRFLKKSDTDLYEMFMQEYIRSIAGDKITGINDTTLDLIRDVMEYTDDMVEFRNGVMDVFDKHIKTTRANTIARTETAYASNTVGYEQFKVLTQDSGMEFMKEWVTTLDEDVRDTHNHLDGRSTDYDDPFTWEGKDGTVMMLHPMDDTYNAPAGEIINCRCFIIKNTK